MSTVVIACSSLAKEILNAQKKLNTNYPVYYLDRKYHINPSEMRQEIIKTLNSLDKEVDTVLVVMGFCGGSWEDIQTDKKVIIPHVDDCISLLLHTDDTPKINMKEIGHFYYRELNNKSNSLETMKENLCKKIGEKEGEELFKKWFSSINNLDIIDTGTYDSYDKNHLEQIYKDSKLIDAQVEYVKGSNIIIEKLFSKKWDNQFFILEKGKKLLKNDFFK